MNKYIEEIIENEEYDLKRLIDVLEIKRNKFFKTSATNKFIDFLEDFTIEKRKLIRKFKAKL